MAKNERVARFIEPMECLPVEKIPEGDLWTYELKLYLKRGGRLSEVVRRIQIATFTRPIRADTPIKGPTMPTNVLSRVQAKDRDGNRQLEVVPASGEGERDDCA